MWMFLTGAHPDIVAPYKEPHFFDYDTNYNRGLKYYRSLMPPAKVNQLTLEKTPDYFFRHAAPGRIKDMNESIKLVFIAREPVARMISEYLHFDVRKGKTKRTFEVTNATQSLFSPAYVRQKLNADEETNQRFAHVS